MSGNNVDRNEIAKFEALASRWWDPNSEFKPLHDINPLRLNYIDERAPLPGRKVLDVGCGGGLLSEGMAQRGAHVTGIDMGEAPLSVARLHGLESGIEVDYQQIPIETLAEDPAHIGQYDAITCLEMLEHVPEPASIIQACAKLLRPGGDLFVSTINRNPKSFLFAIVGAEYVLNMLPKGTHEWRKFIRPSEMSDFLRHAGFEVKDLTGMTFNPITKIYKLGRDVDVNYLMHAKLEDRSEPA
ncbi:bifunctional 2-polyprenyl-6-hydroxyphenol methylase/3-demethylubiquinol 3-O-methyltransferase UbiG [Marinobacter sp. R17]|uniref:bifunctional 2-polyprenyl-6-hydroxyphenol methylase/3-demethylubiquinol 3-O-methyltransferase UbiG n=1 Tax=Marinobacter sp. R17 TaxID=2484250 RepID=UPI000F4B03D6|nr:bifunctional 2-polyprenyl-6-hydroxyphenol methylase/3-demethylubiquinol 3-O-methyltransferase UbiG [Marinobacter sp. R17]ROT99244.1 bifunctional 2-polyprenyl-6-hydroxyphenol methylase/3-demethylubiquinol 3-O-methyltransferase UbiG [Marinobacter sp. R17]